MPPLLVSWPLATSSGLAGLLPLASAASSTVRSDTPGVGSTWVTITPSGMLMVNVTVLVSPSPSVMV